MLASQHVRLFKYNLSLIRKYQYIFWCNIFKKNVSSNCKYLRFATMLSFYNKYILFCRCTKPSTKITDSLRPRAFRRTSTARNSSQKSRRQIHDPRYNICISYSLMKLYLFISFVMCYYVLLFIL